MTKNTIISISPDPILESIVELRFKTSLPASVVYGVIYTALKDDFSNAKSLEIMNLPEEVRLKSPQFKNKAWYQLQSEELILQIGPDVLVFNCDSSKDYIGWRSYFKLIHDTLEKIFNTGVIENVTRTGIRYVSFFEEVNIFEKIKLNIQYDSKGLSGENTLFTTDLKGESFTRRLTVQNNSLLQKDNIQKLGSVVDIDAFNTDSIDELSNIVDLIDTGHKEEKELFFDLLNADFIETLNPKYEEEEND